MDLSVFLVSVIQTIKSEVLCKLLSVVLGL